MTQISRAEVIFCNQTNCKHNDADACFKEGELYFEVKDARDFYPKEKHKQCGFFHAGETGAKLHCNSFEYSEVTNDQ